MLPTTDTHRLAADFSSIIRGWLSPGELDAIETLNLIEPDALVDHVNDFVDAGSAMAEAIERQHGHGWSAAQLADAIADAWSMARAANYRMELVLVGCEFSGRVRDAITATGHYAVSCDVLATESPGPHVQADVRHLLTYGFDKFIAFPPCTYLAASQWFRCKRDPARMAKSVESLGFVRELLDAPIEHIALENPVGRIGTQIKPATQWVHPYEFGDDASKRTGFWLKNLPPLTVHPDQYIAPRITAAGKQRWSNQTDGSGASNLSPSPDRWKIRSRTYPGIAAAMARDWFTNLTTLRQEIVT